MEKLSPSIIQASSILDTITPTLISTTNLVPRYIQPASDLQFYFPAPPLSFSAPPLSFSAPPLSFPASPLSFSAPPFHFSASPPLSHPAPLFGHISSSHYGFLINNKITVQWWHMYCRSSYDDYLSCSHAAPQTQPFLM